MVRARARCAAWRVFVSVRRGGRACSELSSGAGFGRMVAAGCRCGWVGYLGSLAADLGRPCRVGCRYDGVLGTLDSCIWADGGRAS